MREFIYNLTIRTVAAGLAACICEYILPQGKIKASAQKAIGLMTVLFMAQPFFLS